MEKSETQHKLVISHWKTKNKGVPEPVEGRKTKDKGQKCRLGRDVPVTELVEVWNVSTRNPTPITINVSKPDITSSRSKRRFTLIKKSREETPTTFVLRCLSY